MDGLRILHWNIHSWTDSDQRDNTERVAAAIGDTDVDVAALVEVDEPTTGPSPLTRVASAVGMRAVFVPSFDFGDQHSVRGSFGNAILTRLPILGVRHHQLLWPTRLFDGSEPSEPRSLLLVQVTAPFGPCWVASTHLPRSDAPARTAALERVLDLMAGLEEPWVMVGDFNTPASTWISERRELSVSPVAPTPTHPAHQPVECIDYAIAPSTITTATEVLDVDGSDHLALLCIARISGL